MQEQACMHCIQHKLGDRLGFPSPCTRGHTSLLYSRICGIAGTALKMPRGPTLDVAASQPRPLVHPPPAGKLVRDCAHTLAASAVGGSDILVRATPPCLLNDVPAPYLRNTYPAQAKQMQWQKWLSSHEKSGEARVSSFPPPAAPWQCFANETLWWPLGNVDL